MGYLYNLNVYDEAGTKIANSESATLINSIQMNVGATTILFVEIKLVADFNRIADRFRLFVVGSSSYINKWNLSGNHIKK